MQLHVDEQVGALLRTFRAADPAYQDTCVGIINGTLQTHAEHQKDVYIWRNYFVNFALKGLKGYYVDSGANRYRSGSNTWFFDRCLGWDGLCIEANPEYHANLAKHRSCTLSRMCISDRPKTVPMLMSRSTSSLVDAEAEAPNAPGATSGAASRAAPHAAPRGRGRPPKSRMVRCDTLHAMLARAGRSPAAVDFWSLDVEGHELSVLGVPGWERNVSVRVLLVEDIQISSSVLDRTLLERGVAKVAQLPVDALYVNASALSGRTAPLWRGANYDADWQTWLPFRRQQRHPAK